MAVSERPCSSSKSPRLYQASANAGSIRIAAYSAASASTLRPQARSMFPRLKAADGSLPFSVGTLPKFGDADKWSRYRRAYHGEIVGAPQGCELLEAVDFGRR